MGPIVAGVVNGMMGAFYPLDKGLSVIKEGTPWVIQGAVLSSTFYHLVVNDKDGWMGRGIRLFCLLLFLSVSQCADPLQASSPRVRSGSPWPSFGL